VTVSQTALNGWALFPVRYRLKFYVIFRRNSTFKVLTIFSSWMGCSAVWYKFTYISEACTASVFTAEE
jgi:hypothetical protein